MKKKRFKYQQGGAPKIFNVQLPNGSVEPFAPLIQMAAQPIETGLQAMQMVEAFKQRKLQEDRFKQQMAFDQLRFAADQKRFESEEEQRKLNNDFLNVTRTSTIVDPDINVPTVDVDQPLLESVKERHKVTDAYREYKKKPTTENREILMNRVSTMVIDPDYQRIRKRYNEDALFKSRQKTDLKDKEGYYTTNYEDFLKQNTDKITYTVDEEGYNSSVKLTAEKKKQDIEKSKLDMQKTEAVISKEKEDLIRQAELKEKLAPLVKEFETATPERRAQITKEAEQISLISNLKGDPTVLGKLSGSTSDDFTKTYTEALKRAEAESVAKIMVRDGVSLDEAKIRYDSEKATTKKNYEQRIPELNRSLDELYNAGDMSNFLNNLGGTYKPSDATVKSFTSRLNTHTWNKNGAREGYYVSYVDKTEKPSKQKQWTNLATNSDVKFIPDFDDTPSINNGQTEMGGYLYKRIKNSELEDYEKAGWTIDESPLETKYGVKMAKGNSDFKVVRTSAYINLGEIKNTAPVAPQDDGSSGSNIPTVPNYSENYLKDKGVIIDPDPDASEFTYSLKRGLIPSETIKAIGDLPAVLGDDIIPTGHWHHLRLPERDSTTGTKIKNLHTNGRVAPNNFDISLRNFASDIWSPKDHEAIYQSLVNNPAFLQYLKTHNYAVVLEGFDPKSKYPSIEDLKKVPIMKSELKGDAPHLSFEYLGESKANPQKPWQ